MIDISKPCFNGILISKTIFFIEYICFILERKRNWNSEDFYFREFLTKINLFVGAGGGESFSTVIILYDNYRVGLRMKEMIMDEKNNKNFNTEIFLLVDEDKPSEICR